MTPIDHSNYNLWIDRFMQGDTSIAEEHQLYAYFARPDLPEGAVKYRDMFAWYASLSAGPVSSEPSSRPRRRLQGLSRRHWMAAAASVTLLLGLLAGINSLSRHAASGTEDTLYSITDGYIIRNGVRITDPDIVIPAIRQMERDLELSAASATRDLDMLATPDSYMLDLAGAYADSPSLPSLTLTSY